MKKITVSLASLFIAFNLSAATTPAIDLSQSPYVQAGYALTQINYKATDSIYGTSTSGYGNAINRPVIAFGFPISPLLNVEVGYSFPSEVTGGQSMYHINSQTSYLKLIGHYSIANNFALLLGAGPAITTTPDSYYVYNGQNVQVTSSIMDFNVVAGGQYFFTSNLGVKATVDYGFYKSSVRKSSLTEALNLVYLI